jgi:undecaprenyl-diphosphatase
MEILHILFLAIVQGAAELLPVSSSAHVIIAEKLMGLDPTTPFMTLILVCLHTGTMFAVIWYFRKDWKERFFSSKENFMKALRQVVIATLATGVLGLLLKFIIEKITHDDIEALFGNLSMIGAALIVVGTLIIYTDRVMNRGGSLNKQEPTDKDSLLIGLSQGLCLPFRGLSRSGVTISTALLQGVNKSVSEGFSFALAVVLTPPVVAKEIHRFWKQEHIVGSEPVHLAQALMPCLLGMVFSFVAGLIALKFLSRWLEQGRWRHFGYYCYAVAAIAFIMSSQGM